MSLEKEEGVHFQRIPLIKESFQDTRDRYFPGGFGENLISAKNS